MTKEQVAHLNQRIQQHHNSVRYLKHPPEPAAVKKAAAVLAAYETDKSKRAKDHGKRIDEARTHAQEAVLSSDWPAALAAVKKFEATK